MQQTTFQEYLEKQLGKEFELEDPFDQMEYSLTAIDQPEYQTRLSSIEWKSTFRFMNILDTYLEQLKQKGMIFRDLVFREEVIVSAKDIEERFYSLDNQLPIPDRLKIVSKWLLEQLKDYELLEREKEWVEAEVQYLDPQTYQQLYKQLTKEKAFTSDTFDDFDREYQLLASFVVARQMKPTKRWMNRYGFIDVIAIYRRLFENEHLFEMGFQSIAENWSEIARYTIEQLNARFLSYEDATPYLYLMQQIKGLQVNTHVRHLFIDEAQDYSAFQFAFLKRLFPRAKMTVLGDFNQSIFAHTVTHSGFDSVLELYEPEQTEKIILTKSYRSTWQIVDLTRRMIPRVKIEPFQRMGRKPLVCLVKDQEALQAKVIEQVQRLRQEGHTSIGIICKTAKESGSVHQSLKNSLNTTLITKDSATFNQGTVVIPSYLAKGIEFDAVIVYNASRECYNREEERKLFYTICTRAMHELVIVIVGDQMSPFIEQVDPTTYLLE